MSLGTALSCIACGGSSFAVALKKSSFEILRCDTCGLGRTRAGSDFDPASYYDESYFQGGVADGYADYVGSADILRAEFRHVLRDLLPGVHRGRLLEFGCAYGFFLDEARPHFDSVHGIEYADAAARACRARGLDVATGSVDDSTLRGPYDVAVGLDVIEHVPQPHEMLRAIASHMRCGGTLIMTTGDWASLVARVTGAHWRLMTPPQHLSFFTPQSMRKMLEAAGFRIVSLSHPSKRVPLSLIAYQVQRMAGLRPRSMPLINAISIRVNLWDAMRVIAVKDVEQPALDGGN